VFVGDSLVNDIEGATGFGITSVCQSKRASYNERRPCDLGPWRSRSPKQGLRCI
jgi:FMN phosphatase YigB (HAD superfamily)